MPEYHHRGNPPYYHPTAMVAEIVQKEVVKRNTEPQEHYDKQGRLLRIEYIGGIEAIARRVPTFLVGISENSVPRRLWSILNAETFRVSTETTDAILMACDMQSENDTDLPTFPAHASSAREMIQIHQEETNDPLHPIEAAKLERTLVNFCKGFCLGLHLDAEDILELMAVRSFAYFAREAVKAGQEDILTSQDKRRKK